MFQLQEALLCTIDRLNYNLFCNSLLIYFHSKDIGMLFDYFFLIRKRYPEKLQLIMKIRTFFIVLLITTICFSQTIIEGFIYDKRSKESLPFATIKIISKNNYYTITNEDGKFEISDRFASDSIEVRFLGFKTKKIPISYFKKNEKLYLSPNVTPLKTVLVVAEKKIISINYLKKQVQL